MKSCAIISEELEVRLHLSELRLTGPSVELQET